LSSFLSKTKWIILGGLVFGTLGALAVNWGNPNNMGLCVACFLRDIAGALQLHTTATVQYLRPEIFGFVLGSFGTSLAFREWRPRGGSSPIIRFLLAICVMIGAMVFLGCPIRDLLRFSGGDLSALVGLAGLIVGVLVGIFFLKRGFTLGRTTKVPKITGLVVPIFALVLFVLLIIKSGVLSFTSADGAPGSLHVNPWLGLVLGLVVGFIVQRTRFCSVGAWRDVFLTKNFYLLSGIVAFVVGALVTNYVVGNFGASGLFGLNVGPRDVVYHWGFTKQPIALPYADADGNILWSQYIWSFLSFSVVGLGATLMGGCPLRTTIMAGEGDTDAGISILGYIAGGAIAMNFMVASSGAGMGKYGTWGVAVALVFCLAIGFLMREKEA